MIGGSEKCLYFYSIVWVSGGTDEGRESGRANWGSGMGSVPADARELTRFNFVFLSFFTSVASCLFGEPLAPVAMCSSRAGIALRGRSFPAADPRPAAPIDARAAGGARVRRPIVDAATTHSTYRSARIGRLFVVAINALGARAPLRSAGQRRRLPVARKRPTLEPVYDASLPAGRTRQPRSAAPSLSVTQRSGDRVGAAGARGARMASDSAGDL